MSLPCKIFSLKKKLGAHNSITPNLKHLPVVTVFNSLLLFRVLYYIRAHHNFWSEIQHDVNIILTAKKFLKGNKQIKPAMTMWKLSISVKKTAHMMEKETVLLWLYSQHGVEKDNGRMSTLGNLRK